jgi:hypothetical protein
MEAMRYDEMAYRLRWSRHRHLRGPPQVDAIGANRGERGQRYAGGRRLPFDLLAGKVQRERLSGRLDAMRERDEGAWAEWLPRDADLDAWPLLSIRHERDDCASGAITGQNVCAKAKLSGSCERTHAVTQTVPRPLWRPCCVVFTNGGAALSRSRLAGSSGSS